MPAGAMRMMMGKKAAAGGFDPETSITWHSLFWAEGTDFVAQGYTDTASVTTWPNETSESDGSTTNDITYEASNTALGQPAVLSGGAGYCRTPAFTTNPDYTSGISIVIIAEYTGSSSAVGALVDGITSGGRHQVLTGNTFKFDVYAGSTQSSSNGVHGTGAHSYLLTFDGSTGNETLSIDGGADVIAADAGSQTITGLSIGNRYDGHSARNWLGSIAFVGLYEGDITADGAWSDLQTWASDHYGVTL